MRTTLVDERKAIFDWARGDATVLSARCAKAEQVLEARSRLLLQIEGTILGYWTDIPQAELERLRISIREVLGNYEPKAAT